MSSPAELKEIYNLQCYAAGTQVARETVSASLERERKRCKSWKEVEMRDLTV